MNKTEAQVPSRTTVPMTGETTPEAVLLVKTVKAQIKHWLRTIVALYQKKSCVGVSLFKQMDHFRCHFSRQSDSYVHKTQSIVKYTVNFTSNVDLCLLHRSIAAHNGDYEHHHEESSYDYTTQKSVAFVKRQN